MNIGIDLALRKIGLVMLKDNGNIIDFNLIVSDIKDFNGVDLLKNNRDQIKLFIDNIKLKKHKVNVCLEGLSFGSKSPVIDLIDANHWMARLIIADNSYLDLTVVSPKTWMKDFLTKDILEDWAKRFPIIRAKRGMKLTKDQTSANTKSKSEIRKESKEFIYNKIPSNIRDIFEAYLTENKLPKDGRYDLSDAYHLANYIRNKNGS